MTIKCKKCKTKLFKYKKIGKGNLIKAYKSKIMKFYKMNRKENFYFCKCGNKIGRDEKSYIKMYENYKYE